VFALATAPAAAAAITVSSPPALAGAGFTVKVKGASGKLSMYLSPQRKLARGDVSLGRVRATHGKVKVRVSLTTKPGGYFVLACSGAGRRRHCGASKQPTVVFHKRSPGSAPPGVNGVAVPAPGSATSGTLSAAGGEITATGPEGTKYTLAYNASAAAEGTSIALVPIASLSGAGVGRLAGGVEIEPEGIVFAHGAALLVQPAHAVSPATRVALAFSEGGQSIHRTPTAPVLKQIILPVGVSGGFAVTSGGALAAHVSERARAAEVQQPRARAAAAASGAAFYENLCAEFLHELLASGSQYSYPNGSPASMAYEAAVIATLDEWYDEITIDLLPPALESDAGAEHALAELGRWAQLGALTLGDGFHTAATDLGDVYVFEGMQRIYGPKWEAEKVEQLEQKITGAAYDRHQEKCAREYSGEEQQNVYNWYHRGVLYGAPNSSSVEEVYACSVFTLEFESTMDDRFLGVSSDPNGEYVLDYTAKLKLARQFSSKAQPIGGSGTGKYAKAEGMTTQTNECKEQKNTETSRIRGGSGGAVVVPEFIPPATSSSSSVIKLELEMPQENLLVENSVCEPTSQGATLFNWWADWGVSHESAVSGFGSGGLQFTFTLSPGSAADVGTASFTGTFSHNENLETAQVTEIKVQHTPGTWSKL
jgi:hypothetical protein